MKNLLLLLFLLSSNLVSAQLEITFFQQVKNGFAPVILPLKMDTIYLISRDYISKTKKNAIKITDTIRIENHYFLNSSADFLPIASLGDSTTIQVKTKKAKVVARTSGTPEYKVIDKTVEFLPSRLQVNFIGHSPTDLIASNKWKMDTIPPEYRTKAERVLVTGCHRTILEAEPAEYRSFLIFSPQHKLSPQQESKILLHCKAYNTQERVIQIPYDEGKYNIKIKQEVFIAQEGQLKSVAVYSKKEIKALLPKLQQKLTELGFYSGAINNKLEDDFKIALVQYQLAKNAPIGQFDRIGIDALLGE